MLTCINEAKFVLCDIVLLQAFEIGIKIELNKFIVKELISRASQGFVKHDQPLTIQVPRHPSHILL